MTKQEALEQTWQILLRCLNRIGKDGLALAVSGGVDSTLLALAACEADVRPLLAVTFTSVLTTDSDWQTANHISSSLGIEHLKVELDCLSVPQIAHNRSDRCYHCKRMMMQQLREIATAADIPTIIDGSNADDLRDYRPGNKAAMELAVRHPLAECGLNKKTIRELAKAKGLPTHDKPSTPCLASRFPYDTLLDADRLQQVAEGEALLQQMGFAALRLRVHQDIARIEVPESMLKSVLANRLAITTALHKLGFTYVTIDLDGLIYGRFDKTIT